MLIEHSRSKVKRHSGSDILSEPGRLEVAVIKVDHMETPGLGPFVTVTMEMELRVGMGLSWSLTYL